MGGSGAYATAHIDVTPGEVLHIHVGGGGSKSSAGGFPHGGTGVQGTGGGGLSGIFKTNNVDQSGVPLIIAGSGGGGSNTHGGSGGGTEGYAS